MTQRRDTFSLSETIKSFRQWQFGNSKCVRAREKWNRARNAKLRRLNLTFYLPGHIRESGVRRVKIYFEGPPLSLAHLLPSSILGRGGLPFPEFFSSQNTKIWGISQVPKNIPACLSPNFAACLFPKKELPGSTVCGWVEELQPILTNLQVLKVTGNKKKVAEHFLNAQKEVFSLCLWVEVVEIGFWLKNV